MFRANKQWSSEHLLYLENLTANNVSTKDIKQVDLHGRPAPGWVAVTMASQASRDDVVSKGVSIAGKPVDLFIGDGGATSIHVFGCLYPFVMIPSRLHSVFMAKFLALPSANN